MIRSGTKVKKLLILITAILVLCVLVGISYIAFPIIFPGHKKNTWQTTKEGYLIYYKDSNRQAMAEWLSLDGNWYYFDAEGHPSDI